MPSAVGRIHWTWVQELSFGARTFVIVLRESSGLVYIAHPMYPVPSACPIGVGKGEIWNLPATQAPCLRTSLVRKSEIGTSN